MRRAAIIVSFTVRRETTGSRHLHAAGRSNSAQRRSVAGVFRILGDPQDPRREPPVTLVAVAFVAAATPALLPREVRIVLLGFRSAMQKAPVGPDDAQAATVGEQEQRSVGSDRQMTLVADGRLRITPVDEQVASSVGSDPINRVRVRRDPPASEISRVISLSGLARGASLTEASRI
jgi:hypothetical protein